MGSVMKKTTTYFVHLMVGIVFLTFMMDIVLGTMKLVMEYVKMKTILSFALMMVEIVV